MEANPPATAQELAEELWAIPSQWAFGAHWKEENVQKVHLSGADGKLRTVTIVLFVLCNNNYPFLDWVETCVKSDCHIKANGWLAQWLD